MSDLNDLIPREVSPWTTRQKAARMLWAIVESTFFRLSFHNWYLWRAWLLRCFGARIGQCCRIRRTVTIEIPWNLDLGNNVIVGDGAILYALGKITVGNDCMISQYAHLCAGSHDSRFRSYPLKKKPITIGNDCWIAADAFIGPGITIGPRSVVGARGCVFKDVPQDVIVLGNPAVVIRERIFEAMPPAESNSTAMPPQS